SRPGYPVLFGAGGGREGERQPVLSRIFVLRVTRVAPPDSETSDEALVAAAREGNIRALESLILRHESRVLRVLRFLGVGREDRQDVAQEVFLRVFRGLSGFRPGFAFEAWLYRVSVNAAFDHRAGESRRAQAMEPLDENDDSVADH